MDVDINGMFFKENWEKVSGRTELLASIELLKNNFTTHKIFLTFNWEDGFETVSKLTADKHNALLKYLAIFWKLKIRLALLI